MCDEDNDEGEKATADDSSIHIYAEGRWMEQNKDTLEFNGREVAVMQVLSENRLLLLELDQVKSILRSGEGLTYSSVWTTKSVGKSKKKRTYITPLAEDLLHGLNCRLDHLSKLLEQQWINSSNTALKRIAEERSTPEHSVSKSVTVTAEVHKDPSNKEVQISTPHNNPKKKQVTPERTQELKERRRKLKATSKIYTDISDEYLTDSSEVSSIQKLQPEETRKTRAAKRKKPSPRNSAKRLKPNSVERLLTESILISSSSESSDDSSFVPRKEKKNKINKENAKKPHTRTIHLRRDTSNESEDSQNISKKLRSKDRAEPKDVKTGKILHAANTKNTPASNDVSPNSSFDKSLRRPYLKQVMDEAAAVPKQTQNSARLDKENVKKPRSRTAHVRRVTSDESEDSQNISKNLRNKDRAGPKVVETGKILHGTNTSVNTSKIAPASNDISPDCSSLDNPLRRPHLKEVMEEVATATKQTQSSAHLSESSTGTSSYVKNRVYSMLEDGIIIDHILKGENPTLVKGNMLWKRLAKSYFSLANQTRTWQSLKNRYLKYILPNLKYYGLTHDKERLLRSSAYIGDNKKKKTLRENSIFKVHPVISASNVLRQQDKKRELRGQHNEPEPSNSSGRTRERPATPTALMLTSQRKKLMASSTPKQSPKKHDPTYSELTRRFQNKLPFLASSSDDSASGKEFQSTSRSGHRRLFNGKL